MQVFESIKENGVISNKPKGKQAFYGVINNNNSWIISDKSPTKEKKNDFTLTDITQDFRRSINY